MAFLAIFALNFHSAVCTTAASSFIMYSPCKIIEKPISIDNASFFTFFQNIDLILPKFCPKTRPTLFFAGFQWNMLGDSIYNSINFNCNPAVLKKIDKTSKNCQFWVQLHKKGVSMGHTQIKSNFFAEIPKDHKLFKMFCLIRIAYVLTELWMFFYFVWCFFC